MSSLSPLEKQNHMQLGFSAFVGSLGFVVSAALPPFAYLLLCVSGVSLLLYRQQWITITDIHPPFELDKSSLVLTAIAVLIGGFFFMPLDLLSKMLLSAASGAGIAYFFANQCILPSQNTLNNSLIEATKLSNVDEINRLLKLGADPFAPDTLGNCAFHHSIQNHANAVLVLNALHRKAQKADHDFDSLWVHIKTVFTDENIRKQWSILWQNLKTCYNQNNAENRVVLSQAFTHVLESYMPVLKKCLKKLTCMLREAVAYPKNVNCANKRGATLVDILNTLTTIDPEIKKALQQKLDILGVMPGKPIPMELAANDEKVGEPALPAAKPQEAQAKQPKQKR